MVRAYNLKDLEQVMQIWLQTNIEAHDFIPKAYWQGNYVMVKKMMASAHTLGIQILVAEEDDEIKGFIGVMNGYIEGLFVRKDSQGQGIGQRLVSKAKTYYNELSLRVYEKNKNAFDFYQRQGFEGVSQEYNADTNEVEILMKFIQ